MSKAILILGATGKQGGGVLRALLAHPDFSPSEYTILAATRDTASDSAKRLAALSPAVKPVTGDLRNPASTFSALPTKPWAVFVMTNLGKTETQDGIGAIDRALAAGATHVVFSSVDRGVDQGPTDVPHFITKHDIETHLRDVTSKSNGKFSYTIVRPPFFLDNLEPGFFGKVVATLWRDNVSMPLSVIDTRDIGQYAAAALLEPASETYRNKEFDVAGDRLTFTAANRIFEEKIGKPIPTTWSFLPTLLMWLSKDFRMMVKFFAQTGFASKPEETKLHHMASFGEWVDRSKHEKVKH